MKKQKRKRKTTKQKNEVTQIFGPKIEKDTSANEEKKKDNNQGKFRVFEKSQKKKEKSKKKRDFKKFSFF